MKRSTLSQPAQLQCPQLQCQHKLHAKVDAEVDVDSLQPSASETTLVVAIAPRCSSEAFACFDRNRRATHAVRLLSRGELLSDDAICLTRCLRLASSPKLERFGSFDWIADPGRGTGRGTQRKSKSKSD